MEENIGPLLARLDSPDVGIRYQAARELLSLRDRSIVPHLIAALGSTNAFVRTYAAYALGQLGDGRAVVPLIELLAYVAHGHVNVYANVGSAAATALGQLGDRRAVEVLISTLDDPYVALDAVKALSRIGDRRAVQPLIAALRATHDPSMATALGNLGDHAAVEPLLELLRALKAQKEIWPQAAKHVSARREAIFYYYAVRALGKLGDDRALPLLEWIREHERTPVLKGRSIGAMAARAIERIQQRSQE